MVNSKENDINVMVFENSEFGRVRTMVDENGEPLFCGKDVCDALGYRRADLAVHQHVSECDAVKRCVYFQRKLKDGTLGAKRNMLMLFVNESGVYSLIFGSKLESALRFKQWVTSVVLPAIRKNGFYSMLNMKDKLIAEQVERIQELDRTVGDQVVKIQKSAENIVALERDVSRMLPKELYVDNVLDSISCYTTTQIAKELGCTAQELNRSLCACHVQYYQSGQYLLYADYAHMGLAKSRTGFEMRERGIYTHTYLVWTEKGRKFIHDHIYK